MRPVPERCEVRGNVGRSGSASLCPFTPVMAVSVEGLDALYCCKSHSKEMSKCWGAYYTVVATKLS